MKHWQEQLDYSNGSEWLPKNKRVTDKLLQYWQDLKGDARFPSEEDIDPEALKEVWDSCFMIQVPDMGEGGTYNYTYLGSNIIRSYGTDLTQDAAQPLASPTAERLASLYQKVLARKMPVICEGRFINNQGQEIRYRQCLLPFGTGDTVTMIFGGMRYKIYD